MPGLLKYTTTIPAAKTIGEMQTMLVQAGASSVAVHYNDARASGLTFNLTTKYGPQLFTLPIDVAAVQKVLMKQRISGGMSLTKLRSWDQAERVAWRVAHAWLEAQLAIVKVQMATIDQVMLPYLHVGPDKTLYAAYLERQDVLALTDGG